MTSKNFDLIYYCESNPRMGNGHLARGIKVLNFISSSKIRKYNIALAGDFSDSAKSFIKKFLDKRITYFMNEERHFYSLVLVVDTMVNPDNTDFIDENLLNKLKQHADILGIVTYSRNKIKIPKPVTFIINHVPNQYLDNYPNIDSYVGYDYAPVESSFYNINNNLKNNNLLIVLGGYDLLDTSIALIKQLPMKKLKKHFDEIDLVVSPHYPNNKIKNLLEKFGNFNLNILQNIPSLTVYLEKCNKVITSYGNIVFECLASSKDVFVVNWKRFMYENAKILEHEGIVTNLGYIENINKRKLNFLFNAEKNNILNPLSKKSISGIEMNAKTICNIIDKLK